MTLRVLTRVVLVASVTLVTLAVVDPAGRGRNRLGRTTVMLAACVLLTAVPVLAFRWLRPRRTMMMVAARRRWPSRDGRVPVIQWVGLDDVAPVMWLAAIAAEDAYFRYHSGFDWESIRAARAHNRRHEKRRGGSTITQQVAKNLFLWPARSWTRKGAEAYLTLLIEALWPKRRILEMYLNIVQLGEDVFGVEAAAGRYFGRHAAEIGEHEAALLAAALPGPVKYRVDAPSHEMRFRQSWVLAAMRRIGVHHLEGL